MSNNILNITGMQIPKYFSVTISLQFWFDGLNEHFECGVEKSADISHFDNFILFLWGCGPMSFELQLYDFYTPG